MAEAANNDAIGALVDELERKIDRSGANAMISEADGLRGYEIVGNKQGLLRLGVELMTAALRLRPGATRVTRGLSYLRTEDVGPIVGISRNDDVHDPIKRHRRKIGIGGIMWVVAVAGCWIFTLICLGTGFVTVTKSLVQWYYAP